MNKTLEQRVEELEAIVSRLEKENHRFKKDIDTIEEVTKKYMYETDHVIGVVQERLENQD